MWIWSLGYGFQFLCIQAIKCGNYIMKGQAQISLHLFRIEMIFAFVTID